MAVVKVEKGESADKLIRRFIKKIKKLEIIEQVRERRYYKKPSDKRREDKKRRSVVIKKLASERHLTD